MYTEADFHGMSAISQPSRSEKKRGKGKDPTVKEAARPVHTYKVEAGGNCT